MENKFGIDTSQLEHEDPKKFNPIDTVPGRVVQVDADFLAYQVSFDEEISVSEMKSNCDSMIERLRLVSGAEKVNLHLTPKGSNKGGRYEQAIQKKYQDNRKNKVAPKFLHVIREWMHKERDAILHMNCEADDGMAIEQYKALSEGNGNLSIIASKDKDLCMIPGLQLDWDTNEISDTETDFGYIDLVVMGNKSKTKKIKGRGWKFFWAQMLMGDTADNIQGLPKVCLPKFCPTGKPKACGPVITYDILRGIDCNKQAFQIVKDLYKACGDKVGYKDYRDNKPVSFGHVFKSEAQLLWMRRKDCHNDVLDWMQEYCL